MKNIQYKTQGATLEAGPDGKMVKKPFYATAEIPFSEENLLQAESKALPGTVKVVETSERDDRPVAARDRVCLIDRATGKPFEVYIENGQLMMEVM